ncbi:hypothetical protein IMZ48_29975, partial [Candidatus Bathyarchaeota archaeon]|nr:hypothetical protein [Candidatus Bathyarchaeota archaeon]
VNTITITAGGKRGDSSSSHWEDDERGLTRDSGRIMQTKEVAVEYQDQRDAWGDQHEMDHMRRTNHSL